MRPFAIARFAAYALIVAVGAQLLFGNQPPGPPAEARWVNGLTSQHLPISVRMADHRVTQVRLRWEARCAGGPPIRHGSLFGTADLEHRGQYFASRTPGSRVSGQANDGVARGSADLRSGSCESGTIGFALDL